MPEIFQLFAEQYGLVILYALIILFISFSATGIKHLLFALSILVGLMITLFQAFNLKAQFGLFDVTKYLPVSQDIGNMLVAAGFVYVLGFLAFGLKSMFVTVEA